MTTEKTTLAVNGQVASEAVERPSEEFASQIDEAYNRLIIDSAVTFIRACDGLQEHFVGVDKLFEMFEKPGDHRDAAIEFTDSLNELFLDFQRRISRKAEEYRRIAKRKNDDDSHSEQLTPF